MVLSSLILALAASQAAISEETLLRDYIDFERLLLPPIGGHLTGQASSYDRRSTQPGHESWFANGDAGNFQSIERRDGREERVLIDTSGPGSIMRIWSANPAGTLRFYIDDPIEPTWTVGMAELLGGKAPGIGEPFAYVAARGWNLYYPIPFRKSVKVTVSGPGTEHLYYHVGLRFYPAGTNVVSFDPEPKSRPAAVQRRIADALAAQARIPRLERTEVEPGKSAILFEGSGPAVIHRLTIRPGIARSGTGWSDPMLAHNALRRLWIRATFDGERCIEVPLGDFFGSGVGLNVVKTLPMQVSRDGTMTCRFLMPFATYAKLEVLSFLPDPVALEFAAESRMRSEVGPYRFKAQWLSYRGPTRPFRDMRMLDVAGQGWLVGSVLAIENTRPEWWGEGDEKIFVDSDGPLPNYFGTGTEDFYGYAWCDPAVFNRPFHAQPRADGPGNFGHTTVQRWLIGDAIPFRRRLKFDMELWHWAECEVKFSRVSYWYGTPGTGVDPIDPSLLLPMELIPSPPIKGAIEGESLAVVSRSGGNLENQGGFWELSAGRQLWWTRMNPGDTLKLRVPVAKAGRYRVIGNFCRNRDYGKHRLSFLGLSKEIDFYSDKLLWERIDLGEIRVPRGSFEIVVRSLGRREGALEGNMFGLDYLLLEPISPKG